MLIKRRQDDNRASLKKRKFLKGSHYIIFLRHLSYQSRPFDALNKLTLDNEVYYHER